MKTSNHKLPIDTFGFECGYRFVPTLEASTHCAKYVSVWPDLLTMI